MAEELEKQRVRNVVVDIAGPGNQDGTFTNEFVSSRASELFIGYATLLHAFAELTCQVHSLDAFESDGTTRVTPAANFAKSWFRNQPRFNEAVASESMITPSDPELCLLRTHE
jgi:hypothetical protein